VNLTLDIRQDGRPVVVCPLLTPLAEGEFLDERALHQLVTELNDGVDGFMVAGTTGEATLLRQEVVDEALRAVLAARAPGRAVIGCVVATGTAIASELAGHYAKIGVDYVALSTPPYFSDIGDVALVRHFTEVADRSPVPVLAYNIPSRTNLPITLEVARELANHPNIAGLKDSSGDWQQFCAFLNLRNRSFAVLQGGPERLAPESLRSGAGGLVCGLENLAPGLMGKVRDHSLLDGDALASLMPVVEVLAHVTDCGHPIAAMKAGLAVRGIGTGLVARPLPPVAPRALTEIRNIMALARDLHEKAELAVGAGDGRA
jgi:4-hydroxy-tetrahydrodipicolinate synthase